VADWCNDDAKPRHTVSGLAKHREWFFAQYDRNNVRIASGEAAGHRCQMDTFLHIARPRSSVSDRAEGERILYSKETF
jgi:hypothetical protein